MEGQKESTEVQDVLTLHRAERFLELGFTEDDSFVLAEALGENGFPLYWGDVKKFLEQGATQEQVIAICG